MHDTHDTTAGSPVRVNPAGRRDLEDLFRLSGVLQLSKLNHTPFLAFVVEGNTVDVRIIDRVEGVLALPPETPVMIQWRGSWRSDFFQMTVADIAAYLHAAESAQNQAVSA